jgi:hypothetical protein
MANRAGLYFAAVKFPAYYLYIQLKGSLGRTTAQEKARWELLIEDGRVGIFRSDLWKWHLFQATGIVKVPDISGDWSGYVTSSFDSLAEKHPVRVRIQQNWTHLLIQLSAEQSESESIVASMAVGEETVLTYQYRNTPKPGATETMHAHIGTAVLKLHDNRRELSGEYYSGRDRTNQGIIALTKYTSS